MSILEYASNKHENFASSLGFPAFSVATEKAGKSGDEAMKNVQDSWRNESVKVSKTATHTAYGDSPDRAVVGVDDVGVLIVVLRELNVAHVQDS